jgi:Bacteriophage clamp loader A subunit
MSPFDFADVILRKKKLEDFETVDFAEYKPFLVNRSLSSHLDCILHVNELNQYPSMDADMQFQYLLNSIRPMKRKFNGWNKAEVLKDLDCVKEYFGYSNQKAKEALRILSEEDIAEIKRRTEKGGVKNNDRNTGSN